MSEQTQTATFSRDRAYSHPSKAFDSNNEVSLTEERLPFTVRLVRNEDDLRKAVQIRHSAYARHLPAFAETLKIPEAMDSEPGNVVMLAESRVDGSPLGTMRVQTNEFKPLALEQSVDLPEWMQTRPLAEATRLGIAQDRLGHLVKAALFKSYFQYCQLNCIEWMVIAGRAPIDRQYERLLFQDVYPGMGFVPLRHANNMPHRIMSFEVATAEQRWGAANHPLFNFIFRTRHSDLDFTPRAGSVNFA
jgi:hypothetical protein